MNAAIKRYQFTSADREKAKSVPRGRGRDANPNICHCDMWPFPHRHDTKRGCYPHKHIWGHCPHCSGV